MNTTLHQAATPETAETAESSKRRFYIPQSAVRAEIIRIANPIDLDEYHYRNAQTEKMRDLFSDA